MIKLLIFIFKYIMSRDLYRPDLKLDPHPPLNQVISGTLLKHLNKLALKDTLIFITNEIMYDVLPI